MMRDALVVGINSYRYLPTLQAPAHDAEAIAEQLHTHGEFRVHRLPEIIQDGKPQIGQRTPVHLKDLEAALVKLFKPKGSAIPQTALFYFSGHGIQKDAGIQEGYLAVSDSNPDTGFYGLSLFWLRRLLQESPVRQRIIWLDCCHSGELLNFLEADPGARAGTDRLLMAASREYEPAFESLDSPYSVFTQAILAGLNPARVDNGIVTNYSLTDWVSHALKAEIQQPLFENSGSEIILTRQQPCTTAAKAVPSQAVCPYRGLECFDEAHAEYFFGREELTDHLLDKLRVGQFVAVVGASGSGKSSLVQAGLMQQLRQGKAFSGSDRWRIKCLTPTEHPLKSLAAAFIDADSNDLDKAEQLYRAESFLQHGGTGLAQLVRGSLPLDAFTSGLSPTDKPCMLLVIDQFEEVFTLCRGDYAERERQHFFNCLVQAQQMLGSLLRILVVLRADFFSKCSLYESLAQQIEQHLVLVTPLTDGQIKATIIRPAEKVGLHCDPNLVNTMVSDVMGAPGELPLLQYTLLELWQQRQIDAETGVARLTLAAYTELGGVRGTLQKRATQSFYQLTAAEQQVAKRIFLALTQLGEGTEDTRRRIVKSELMSSAYPAELVEGTLEKLVAAKLIVTNQAQPGAIAPYGSMLHPPGWSNRAEETIDVAHEALIRNWSLLRLWLDDNRDMLGRLRRIERSAQEWNSAGQPVGTDYLLRGGRLADAEDVISSYPHELSELAQRYIQVSRDDHQRSRYESRLLQIAVPSVLLVALMITVNQYRSTAITQSEQDYQLKLAMSRERAAIAQTILQNPRRDPTTALLISRLAAEGGLTYEAQSSLRASLQSLRLQLKLDGHTGAVSQLHFSPQRDYLASAGSDGTIRLWRLPQQQIYTGAMPPWQTLAWDVVPVDSVIGLEPPPQPTVITDLTISPTGGLIAAIAQDSSRIKVWSVESGEPAFVLDLPQAATDVAFSADGQWLATAHGSTTVMIWHATTGQLVTQLATAEPIHHLQFSPTGSLLMTQGTTRVQLWSLVSNTADATHAPMTVRSPVALPAIVGLATATFSPTGRWILTTARDGVARLWNPMTATSERHFATAASGSTDMQSMISPNEAMVAVLDGQQQLWLWDLASGQLKQRLTPSRPPALAQKFSQEPLSARPLNLEFSPDNRWVVTRSQPTTAPASASGAAVNVTLWNITTGQPVHSWAGEVDPIVSTRFSPDSQQIATASGDGSIKLWATEAGGELPTLTLPASETHWLSFVQPVPRPSTASTNLNHTLSAIAPPSEPVPRPQLVSISHTGALRQWQLAEPITSPVSPSRSSHWLVAVKPDFNLYWQWFTSLWSKPRSSQALTELQSARLAQDTTPVPQPRPVLPDAIALPPSLTAMALSPDGTMMAIATPSGGAIIQQIQADQSVTPLHSLSHDHKGTALPIVQSLAFSADQRVLLGVGRDQQIWLWDVQSGQMLHQIGPDAAVYMARFSPDSQRFVAATADRTVRIWNTASGQIELAVPLPDGAKSASLSADGTLLVVVSQDGTVHLFNGQTGMPYGSIPTHPGEMVEAQFSPDGHTIATISRDGAIYLWNADTGMKQGYLQLPDKGDRPPTIQQLTFTPDGHYVAALTQDGKVHLWAASWSALLKLARDRTPRQLTAAECSEYLNLSADQCPQLD